MQSAVAERPALIEANPGLIARVNSLVAEQARVTAVSLDSTKAALGRSGSTLDVAGALEDFARIPAGGDAAQVAEAGISIVRAHFTPASPPPEGIVDLATWSAEQVALEQRILTAFVDLATYETTVDAFAALIEAGAVEALDAALTALRVDDAAAPRLPIAEPRPTPTPSPVFR